MKGISKTIALVLVAAVLLTITGCTGPTGNLPAQDHLRIALLADTHTTTEAQFEMYNEHFRAIAADVNTAGVDVVLIAGDLANHGKVEEFRLFNRLKAELHPPVFCVAGNHDVGNKLIPGESVSLSSSRLERYEQETGELYYDERIGPHTRLVAITSSLLSSGMPAEEEQWRYLDAHLPAAGHERVILLSHYPLFVDDPDEPASYMNIDPAPRARLISLLDRHGVGLMLCGHQHRPMDRWAGRTRMITAPPVSFGLPRGQQPEGWTLITLDEAGNIEVENRFLPGK